MTMTEIKRRGRPHTTPSKEELLALIKKASIGSSELDCRIEKFFNPNSTYHNVNDGRMRFDNNTKSYIVPHYTTNYLDMLPYLKNTILYSIISGGRNNPVVILTSKEGHLLSKVSAKTNELAFCLAVIEVL